MNATAKAAPVQTAAVIPLAKPRYAHPNKLRSAEHARNSWSIVPDDGTTIEEVCQPAYFAHVAGRMQPGDLIEVRAEDTSYYARLYVRDTGRAMVKCAVLEYHSFEAIEFGDNADTQFDVAYRGLTRKWCVVRKSDNTVIKDECQTREGATSYLGEYLKALAK